MTTPNQPGRKPSQRIPGNQPPKQQPSQPPGARPPQQSAQKPAAQKPAVKPAAGKPAAAPSKPAAAQPKPAAPRGAAPAAAQKPAQKPQPAKSAQSAAPAAAAAAPATAEGAGAPKKAGWMRRIVGICALAVVLLVGALVAHSWMTNGAPDLTSEEGVVAFVRSLFSSGRDMRSRSGEMLEGLKAEMGGLEKWLSERKLEVPKTDDLLKKADELLAAGRDKLDTAFAPPDVAIPPKQEPEVVLTLPPPTQPKPEPVVPLVPKPEPKPEPVAAPKPVAVAVPKPVPAPAPVTAPIPAPAPTPAPKPVTAPAPVPKPAPISVPQPAPKPAPAPEPVAAPEPPPPPANPELAEAQAALREGLEHYRLTRNECPEPQKELRESSKCFRKAQGLLVEAAKREPNNRKIEDLQVQVNRFLYDSIKRQTL